MSLLTNIALGLGGIAAGSAAWGGLTNSYSEYHQGAWDWQYKGAAFKNRVGEFSFYSDNKSRYNDYLKDYGSVIGHKSNLTTDVQAVTQQRTIEEIYKGNTTYATNENLRLIGNPTGANTGDSNNLILENRLRDGTSPFVTSYNTSKGRPNWVAFKLTKEDYGNTTREGVPFILDPNIPSDLQMDAAGIKGFQRGHNYPAGSATASLDQMSSTFVMTNMTAQAGAMNTGPWAGLEHYLANQVKDNNKEVQVLTGNFGRGGVGTNGYVERIGGVEVPELMWKVAIILEPGQTQVTENAQTVVSVMPNKQDVKKDWQNYRVADGNKLRKKLGYDQFFPGMDPKLEEKILSQMYEPPSDTSKLLNLDDEISDNFKSAAMIRARSRGIHNPLMAPLYDADKSYKGLVISNKKTHSEQFEMARYNASMRATGQFTSIVDVEDMTTFQNILQASKPIGTNLTPEELKIAKAFDFAVNTPSLASRINEYFFIPMGMGRVYKEEKGVIPSLFGAVGGLIDQAFLVNNPALRSYRNDGENYFQTKTSFFQDLLENSAAGILATASSIGVYLAVGEPLKAMASQAILQTQETLLNAADTHRGAKMMLNGDLSDTVGFKMSLIERNINQGTTKQNVAYYDVNNPSFSLYYIDNYARHRGSSLFAATAQDFLLNKISPYKLNEVGQTRLISAINDYVEVLQSPADIRIIDTVGDVVMNNANIQQWDNAFIKTASNGTINIPQALAILRAKDADGKYTVTKKVADEINYEINKKYNLKIENVSIERNLQLAKKLQGILNVVPMPWAWGIFTGRTKTDVTGPMIGNLLDIEGFARHVNASIKNQGFWGAANEYMVISKEGNKASNPVFRIVNHLATMTRSVLAFNEQGGKSKADLDSMIGLTKTYSAAEIELDATLSARGKTNVKNSSAQGYTVFNTNNMADDEVRMMLDNEANYQKEWKALAQKRPGLQTITLDKKLFKYAGEAADGNGLGYALNLLERGKGNSYTGMKVASTKLAAAKWIIGALFIPQLVGTEYLQRTGVSLFGTQRGQDLLNKGTTNTVIELQSNNFISVKEVARGMGLDVNTSNLIGGVESLVSMAGIANWAYNHASTFSPEIYAKMFQGQNVLSQIEGITLPDTLDPKTNTKVPSVYQAVTDIQAQLKGVDDFLGRVGNNDIAFRTVTENGQVTGLKVLNAKVMKNMTSFTISLGLTLAAMQTARYVVSSAINSERQLTGSAFLSTYLLAVPATILAAAAMIDNTVHTINAVGGFTGKKIGYNNYYLTGKVATGALYALQGATNMMFKNGVSTLVSLALLGTVTGVGYNFKLTPFQGDINGPKADELNITAMTKLGSYVTHVNRRIDEAKRYGGDAAISERVSPLEVNAALLAVSLGKIMNPILSSQKGSTAYVTAIQSPTPIFQFYSVIKKIEDKGGNSYTTVGLGLQGPPAFGFAPINVSLPIAFAMNKESASGQALKTGYFNTGIVLNENNKDSLSLHDYAAIYGQVALWSSVGLTVSSTFHNNRSWGRNKQILKAGGTYVPSEPLLIQSMRGGRDKFMGIATLPFSIAMQSMKILAGDLRMPSLRLTSSAFMPLIFNAVAAGVFSQFMVGVHREATLPFKESSDGGKRDTSWNLGAIGLGALTWTGYQYYKGTIAASRTLASLEDVLVTSTPGTVKFNKKDIDPIIRSMYNNNALGIKNMHHWLRGKGLQGGLFGSLIKDGFDTEIKGPRGRLGKGIGLVAAGALWNHFLTDPKVGMINPEIAYGNLREDTEDTYSWGARRITTVIGGALTFALTASLSTFNIKNFVSTIDYEGMIDSYEQRLRTVKVLEHKVKRGAGFGAWANLKYQEMKLGQQGWEVQSIYEGDMNKNPMIEFLDEQGNKVKEAVKMKDPTAHLREVAKDRGTAARDNLLRLDTTAGTDLNNIAKNNDAKSVMAAIRNGYTDLNLPPDKQAKNLSAALKNSAWLGGGNLGIRTKNIATFLGAAALIKLGAHSFDWISNGLGYKDFQDAFLKEDELGNNSWKQGIVEGIKLITGHDRANNYEIARGLVGPNFKTSEGEFLLSPDTTVKGSLNKAMKNLQKLTLFNSPNIFIGAEIGGITIRADDSDARVRDYFQLQSASQDFSSAMYSMSAVFGLQELKSKGFLPNAIVANLRGIDSGEELNQNQIRSYAAAIITAVASQPIRQGKDRIKFTSPDKFTLDAMQTNKALSMSLNQRYKTLRSLSYANSMQLGLFNLMNNMSISDPSMQNKLMKSLMKLNQNDQMGLGEANQNFFMGGKADPKWVALKAKDDNPFTPLKLSIEETNSENAFSESMGIAMQSTTNQYIEPNTTNIGQLVPSSIKSMWGHMPPPLFIALSMLGIGGVLLIGSAAMFSLSQSQVTKENTALYRQQSKFYDEGDWFSKHQVEAVQLQGANNAQQLKTSQYLLLKRAGVTFNIAEGLSSRLVNEFTQQINELAGALSFTFDSNYRDFSKNYGQLGDEYANANANTIKKLDDFYDAQVSTTTTTVNTGINRADRIARDHSNSFKPIMGNDNFNETFTYNSKAKGIIKDQKIIEHLLDEFTNKQLLDAYLEGQYEAYKAQSGVGTGSKSQFAAKYYPGFTYDDLLKQEVDKSFMRATDKTGKQTAFSDLNIFGKDRNINMEYSINRMKEVYATKFDVIIDNYFDVLESRVNDTFAQFPDKNIYTEFIGSDIYDINKPTSQAEIASHLTNRRMEMKQQLRSNISNELTAIFTVRKQGWTAMFDLARVSLGVANAAKETIMEIRTQGGKVFGGRGNMGAAKELEQAALTAAENELKITTKQGVSNSMNAGPTPTAIQGNTAGKGSLEALTGAGTLIMNAFQAAQFASVNLLTLRAAASIASSKTGEREKEMAKEEMAKEGFENVFAALFWGVVSGNEQLKSFGIPGAVGLAAGYFGYEGIFQKNGVVAGTAGTIFAVGGSLLFKQVNKQWGLSVGLLGLTLIGRSVFDANTSAIKALSPEVGNFIIEQGDRFQNLGRSGFRFMQDNSVAITTPTGLAFIGGGIYNLSKGGNPLINFGIATVGALLFGSGIAKIFEDKSNVNHKADAASRAGLQVIANMVVSKYTSKVANAAGNLVVKTMTSRAAEEGAKQAVLTATGEKIKQAAGAVIGQNVARRAAAKSFAMGAGKLLMGTGRLFGSFFAGPWGLGIAIGISIFQLVSTLTVPDEMDNLTSNISHMPSQWIGQPGHLLLSPSNQIYNDRKYKDVDARNPLFYGTVTDAAKEQWLEQVSTMDDITGRSAAGRNMSSFDAPMIGYTATASGYGPKGLDPIEDMAMNIRGRLYMQQVTGRQYMNTKVDESMNREIVQQRMTTSEKLQVQMWERQINSAVDTQNRKITSKPSTSAEEYKHAGQKAISTLGEASHKIASLAKDLDTVNTKSTLLTKIEQPTILTDPSKQVFLEGKHFTLMANKVEATKNDLGQRVYNFNKTSAPNAEVVAIQYANQGIDHVTANTMS
jgi:endonuclease G